MLKSELLGRLADAMGCSKRVAGINLDAVFEVITDALEEGERVSIPNFGSFSTVERKARKGRNPHTGKSIKIAKHNAVRFKPSPTLKELVK